MILGIKEADHHMRRKLLAKKIRFISMIQY